MTTPLPITWPADGLVPAVIQDHESRDVLMVGFMNLDALDKTRETGFVHFWSRSRQKLWKKGETSGHVQRVRDMFVNCEQNSLLIEVDQVGAVCHDGYPTCYYRRLDADNFLEIVRDRWFDPEDVYTQTGGLRTLTERWWGAYEFLRDHDLTEESGTSRRLRDRHASLAPRITDELLELAGVLDGTHAHGNQQDDLLLEASQVGYWVACEAIRSGIAFDEVRPDRALDNDSGEVPSPLTVATLLRSIAASSPTIVAEQAHAIFALLATAARSLGLEPLDIIRKDLGDLETRDYLAPYFSR